MRTKGKPKQVQAYAKSLGESLKDILGEAKVSVLKEKYLLSQPPSAALESRFNRDDRINLRLAECITFDKVHDGGRTYFTASIRSPLNGEVYNALRRADNGLSPDPVTFTLRNGTVAHANYKVAKNSACLSLIVEEELEEERVRAAIDRVRRRAVVLPVDEDKNMPCPFKERIGRRRHHEEGQYQHIVDSLMMKKRDVRDDFLKMIDDSGATFEGLLTILGTVWKPKSREARALLEQFLLINSADSANGLCIWAISSEDDESHIAVIENSAPADVMAILRSHFELATQRIGLVVDAFLHHQTMDKDLVSLAFIGQSLDSSGMWYRLPIERSGIRGALDEDAEVDDSNIYLKSIGVQCENISRMCCMVLLGAILSKKKWFFRNPKKSISNVDRVFVAYGSDYNIFSYGARKVDRRLVEEYGDEIRTSNPKFADWVTKKATGDAWRCFPSDTSWYFPQCHNDDMVITRIARYMEDMKRSKKRQREGSKTEDADAIRRRMEQALFEEQGTTLSGAATLAPAHAADNGLADDFAMLQELRRLSKIPGQTEVTAAQALEAVADNRAKAVEEASLAEERRLALVVAAEEARRRAEEARLAEEARQRAEEARLAEEARRQAEEPFYEVIAPFHNYSLGINLKKEAVGCSYCTFDGYRTDTSKLLHQFRNQGDYIVAIEGVSMENKSLEQVVDVVKENQRNQFLKIKLKDISKCT